MSANYQHNSPLSASDAPLDDGYWDALLAEGEYTATAPLKQNGSIPSGHGEHGKHDADASLSQVSDHTGWRAATEAYQSDQVMELEVVGYNRGGLLVNLDFLQGFVPASQLVDFPTNNDPARYQALAERIGERLNLRVIELEPEFNRLILSERAAQSQAGARANVLRSLKPGDECTGEVTNLCNFGVFVDLGGVEGLIHISELSWGRVNHPSDILERKQEVRAQVISVDHERGRVALSLKQLQPDPWAGVDERYQVGQIIEGVITNVVDFGAFTCLEEGLEGLIHISELAEGHFLHPRNVVTEGETVRACILNIDGRARRLGLSLRQVPSTIENRTE